MNKQTQRLIKKYPNRRLYDTHASSYVTLADIKALVLECENFAVVDAKTNDDITRTILLQIILEEESGGIPMFTESVLAQIIRLYGNAMQSFMGSFLEKNVQIFAEAQEKFKDNSKTFLDNGFTPNEKISEFFSSNPQSMQNFFGDYMEKSREYFSNIEKQMQANSEIFFRGMGEIKQQKKDGD